MTVSQLKAIVKKILRCSLAAASPLFSRKSAMEEPQALELLEDTWSRKDTTCFACNVLAEPSCDLQIVIPAYNVEEYLEACMESVLSQKTRYSFHVVLVDDGAKDRTGEICDRYRDHPNVTVIHQTNRGLSGARNTGMQTLFGRYVLFVDSDDVLCPGAVEGLLDTAYRMDCDLVEGGAYYLIDGKQSVMHSYAADAMVEDPYSMLHGHAWGKLFRAELLANRCFPEGYWYEDSLMSFLLFGEAGRIGVSAQMVCSYRINQAGIVKSSKGKPRSLETVYLTDQLLKERLEAGLPMDLDFYRFMQIQIRLNQLRLAELDRQVQEAAFVCTCRMLERYFPPEILSAGERNLCKALRTRDFGMFVMCCKFF